MNHKPKKGCLIFIIVFAIIVIAIIITIVVMMSKLKNYDTVDFAGMDLSSVEDGTYTGSEDAGLVKASVEVTVSNHTITKVTILSHDCGKGKPAEVIVGDVVAANSLEVDAISGATLSSNVIKMAIYNALLE